MQTKGIPYLLQGWAKGQLDNREQKQLDELLAGNEQELVQAIEQLIMENETVKVDQPDIATRQIWFDKIIASDKLKEKRIIPAVHRVHFLRTAWFKYAAAILLILTGFFIYYKFSHTSPSGTGVAQTTPPLIHDVMPGFNRAVLTLSDGKNVELDNAASETIKDGDLVIRNNSGQLIYTNSGRGSLSPSPEARRDEGGLNTMTTPRGGQYQLTLADGTRVWLNAASSITFPTAFKGNVREVSITGEAYFEVSADKLKPFIVRTIKESITVLGTSFNVQAYSDEPGKTSLISGSVKIGNQLLKPGQAFSGGKVHETDILRDVAWKNGFFNFDKMSVAEAARQIARWYDVEVKIVGKMTDVKLFGEADRNISLQDLLRGYEGEIAHFELKGRTLCITSL